MAVHEVVLDPDGDILVIVPGKPLEVKAGEPDSVTTDTNGTNINEVDYPAEESIEKPAEPSTEIPAEDAEITEPHQPNGSVPGGEEQWQFKASSKHLSLASTHVKTIMSGAKETHDDGLVHWKFDGFDVDAISIILSVIHGLNRRVPRTVSLPMLAQIARVVDHLECHEVMELYASIWMKHIGDPVPNPSQMDCDYWISVAGVFHSPEIFKNWTRVAIIQKLTSPPSLESPILLQAYDVINQRRQLHLDKIMSCVYDHMDRLSEQKMCAGECDAILLGTLIRHMRANSLPSTRPAFPYDGLSVGSVVKTIRTLAVPEWYGKVNDSDEHRQNPFEFWGATKKPPKSLHKKAKTKVKKKVQSSDMWGAPGPVEEYEELEDLVVVEHNCGFDELRATVNDLESEIQDMPNLGTYTILDPDGDLTVILPSRDRDGRDRVGEHTITQFVPGELVKSDFGYETDSSDISTIEWYELDDDLDSSVELDYDSDAKAISTPSTSDCDERLQGEADKLDFTDSHRFKVSSKHLILASAHGNALTGLFEAPKRARRNTWVLPAFDPEATGIILKIIHHKNRRVPKTLDLGMLVEVAHVVHYLKCYEAIEPYGSQWIAHLEGKIPLSYNTDLLLWICIAGVFRNAPIFEYNHSGIPTLGLPILKEVSCEIEQRRIHLLDEIFKAVYRFKDKLTKDTSCSSECDARILTKHLHRCFGSLPERPYHKMSVSWVVEMITRLPPAACLSWLKKPGRDLRHSGFDGLVEMVNSLAEGIRGLDLVNDLLWTPA
ncbi:hypothetical protein RRF57_004288 [Xylaria bambusicola]|uniref:BTB domain-containing protein n=1 Tax=Xylaria bambusicola TaxID=326684 RepID=A0AAN7UGB4_9PEZI